MAVVLAMLGWEPSGTAIWTKIDTEWLVFAFQFIWLAGAIFAVMRSLQPEGGRHLRRAAILTAVLVAASTAFPHQSIFEGRDFDRRIVNYWEYVTALVSGSFDQPAPRRSKVPPAAVELRQASLLDAAASSLLPQRPGVVDIYSIGIAGWADQDVFSKELDGGLKALSRVLPTEGREIRLINHPTPQRARRSLRARILLPRCGLLHGGWTVMRMCCCSSSPRMALRTDLR